MNRSYIHIVAIAGVRPQFTKIAALQWAIHRYNKRAEIKIKPTYINTGQHYDDELTSYHIHDLNIHFDYHLSHTNKHPIHILGNMIIGVCEILDSLSEMPDWIIVNGDATSAFAGAVAAARKGFPIVHIEAGMRSGSLSELEEINRRMIDHISTVHICSSKAAMGNLYKEGIVESVFWFGDLAYEFIKQYTKKLPPGIGSYPTGEYVILTLHKPENIYSDDTIRSIIYTLSEYDRPVLFIMHPHARKRLTELNLLTVKGIDFIDSLPYSKMLSAMKGCAFIITDSGGLHREAFYLRKRCLVRRDVGGWTALISLGIHRRIGRNQKSLIEGLEWIENAIQAGEYNYDGNEDLIKHGSNEAMLQKLVDLVVKQ